MGDLQTLSLEFKLLINGVQGEALRALIKLTSYTAMNASYFD